MIALFEDTEIARLIPARIASYSTSLLEAERSRLMIYSIISVVGALSCSPSPAPVCCEAPSTFRIHQLELFDFISC